MRLVALAVGMAIASPVCAQTAGFASPSSSSAQALNDIAFISRAPVAPTDPGVGLSAHNGFSTPDFIGESLTGQPILAGGRVAAAGEGLIAWRTSQVSHPVGGGAVDTVRMSVASVSRTPGLGPNAVAYDPSAVDVTVVRGWPDAMLVRAGGIGVNVTPHAGVGLASGGGSSAEVGATFKITSVKAAIQDRLRALGVKNGADTYGNQGRLYLFAAVRGQAVGLNMTETGGALRQAGWSTDQSSALVGDGQVGVGWRKGGMEATVGYVHRGIHVKNAPYGVSDSYADDMAALSLTFHPRW
jgi:hypothetical protein